MTTLLLRWTAILFALVVAAPAVAHPAPFSYLDLTLEDQAIEGTLTVHVIDAAHELGVARPPDLLEGDLLEARQGELEALLAPRIAIAGGKRIEWTGAAALPDDDAIRLSFRIPGAAPGELSLDAAPFPYDPFHQTFVNIYEGGKLRQQLIFDQGAAPHIYYRGTTAGALAVMATFIPSGAHHILVGPDHLLFLFALLLLGGGWRKLVKIVTAFTVGHSVTLSLAALDIVNLPAALIEPAIALSIVVVGVDNLLQAKGEGRDLRAWAAGAFGLVHGFGFANVLKEFGLPQEALGWSLFSFNVGVELGQLAVVVVAASILALIRKRSPAISDRVVTIGSIVVVAAGAYWFVERVFFGGI